MLLLALRWGGISYGWSDVRSIGLIDGAGVEVMICIPWLAYLVI